MKKVKMMIRSETKSSEDDDQGDKVVLGVSFHSKRPWILASLDRGGIELWDYRMVALIKRFGKHQLPVRGVHFNNLRPLFVSGGDDFVVKVWNYDTGKCHLSLLGHEGSVRTVQFHPDSPWILSASEDKTIRIWDWKSGQSGQSLYLLNGHTDWVTCASFHPTTGSILSGSRDQTVRIWDQEKPFSGPFVSKVLTTHTKGVNSVSFHPTDRRLIVSCSDDQVKLLCLKTDGSLAGTRLKTEDILETKHPLDDDTYTNASFQVNSSPIVSTTTRGRIRVWDPSVWDSRRNELDTFDLKHIFSSLAVHPETNLIAAGHDSGFIVFKPDRQRPAFAVSGNFLTYVRGPGLFVYDFCAQRESQHPANHIVKIFSFNPERDAILASSNVDGASYEMYYYLQPTLTYLPATTNTVSAIFVSTDTFVVLQKDPRMLLLKTLDGSMLSQISLPLITEATVDTIFYAGTGYLLCRSEEKLEMLDLQQSLVVCEIQTPSVVRSVVWSSDMERVALLSKHTIMIASKSLVLQCTLHETNRVKSGAWDDGFGVLIYTTLNHLKFCLPNGESGIIRTLDVPFYVTKVSRDLVYCLDRQVKLKIFRIVSSEYALKVSLLRENFDHVKSMIRTSQLPGQAMVHYLQQKGFPEVAFPLAHDEKTRISLVIESGNIDAAVTPARTLNEKDQWHKLAVGALRYGRVGVAKLAYKEAQNWQRLAFLHLLTGDLKNLESVVEESNSFMLKFEHSLFVGDVASRVKVLEDAGHLPLAYIIASVHGLCDTAELLANKLGHNVPSLPEGKKSSLPMPPAPILCEHDLPVLEKKFVS